MPPRVARAGRGRGRGGAANAPSTTPDVVESQSTSNGASTSMAAEPSQDVTMQDAPVTTETAASAPARPPAQAAARGRGRGRGAASAGRGASSAAPPTFKPKAVRRDQTERQMIADEERKRMEEREKAAERAERVRGRGQGRGRGATRSRGAAMGMSFITTTSATGLFSQLPQALPKDGRKGSAMPAHTVVGQSDWQAPTGGGAEMSQPGRSQGNKTSHSNGNHHMGGTTSGGTTSGGTNGSSGEVKVKKELADPVYPGLDSEGIHARGIEVDDIRKVTDGHGDVSGKGKGRAPDTSKGLLPVRVLRVPHKERATVVNTEASAPTLGEEGGSMFVDQDLEAEERARNMADSTGKPRGDDEVKIKPEPGLQETMELDSIPAPERPRSPSTEHVKKEVPSPQARPRTHRAPVQRAPIKRDRKPVLQTEQDKQEWARRLEDIAVMTREFEYLAAKTDANGDVKMEDEDREKEGRLYLFQFPPVLPPLHNPDKVKVKAEPEEEYDDDVVQTSMKPAPGISGSSTAPIDLSKKPNPADFTVEGIKAEPDDSPPKKIEAPANPIVPEEGYVGKLVVRASGKVEMSWGGNSFEINRGAQHQFLMTGILMDKLDDIPTKETNVEGSKQAYGMGAIMGKFNVTPDWDVVEEIL